MVKIKFTAEYEVKAANGAAYKAGDIESMPSSSARHFVRRNVAEYYIAEKKKPKKKAAKTVKEVAKATGENRRVKPDYGNKPDVPEPDRAAIAKRTLPDS